MATAKLGLDEILASVSKEFDVRIAPLAEAGAGVEALSTGNIGIDYITGCGGLPLGRCVELYGQPASGKTTCALMTAALAQRQGKRVLYFDFEQKLDPRYAQALGVDVKAESFLFVQPDNLEQGANVARKLVATGEIDVVIFDSVAAMTPSVLIDKDTGSRTVAEQARLMSEFLKAFVPLLRQTHTLGIFLNHEMELLDMGGGGRPGMPPRKSTPGGRALKYYATLRMQFVTIKRNKAKYHDPLTNSTEETITSVHTLVKTDKNQVGVPHRQALVRVSFGKGYSAGFSALNVLLAYKVITKHTGGIYRFPGLEGIEGAFDGLPVDRDAQERAWMRGEDNVVNAIDAAPRALLVWSEVAQEQLDAGDPDLPAEAVTLALTEGIKQSAADELRFGEPNAELDEVVVGELVEDLLS